jgi:hypothetical protein
MKPPCVRLRLEDQHVVIRPEDRLSELQFRLFRIACRDGGAKMNTRLRANAAPVEDASLLALALKTSGFRLLIDKALEIDLPAARAFVEDQRRSAAGALATAAASRGLALMRFQEDGVEALAEHPAWLLADEMGLGKTVQAVMALPKSARVIVVCPAVVKGVWYREIRRWRPEFFVQALEGRGSFRWPARGAVVVLNYEILPEAILPPPGVHLIGDEIHHAKNPNARRTERFADMAMAVRASGGVTWGLSGTPMPNRPPELRTVLKVLGLFETAFDNDATFDRLFNAARGPGGRMTWGDPSPEVALRLQRVSLRRHRADVLPELPDKTERDLTIYDLPEGAMEICDEAQAALEELGIDIDACQELTALVAAMGKAPFDLLMKARHALAVAKLPAMEEFIAEYEAAGEPLVVFSSHRAPVEAAASRPGWGKIAGDMTAKAKTAAEEAFQAGKFRGIAITIRAGGTGITLTASPHALFVDRDWSPGANDQAADRVYRKGQTRAVTITTMVADHPIDKMLSRILKTKRKLINGTVEASARR